ncbi:MAG: hypothetical protein QM626_02635 [Microbacterium sp.]|uniref:hypothetical protein n=1 Tax=Microbacterium sp. TaxID=51671 RepID=UPI0039E5F5A0
MLQKITSSPSKLWMGRGSHGVTVQEIAALWDGVEARVTVRRAHHGGVVLRLDKVELEAFAAWIDEIVPR